MGSGKSRVSGTTRNSILYNIGRKSKEDPTDGIPILHDEEAKRLSSSISSFIRDSDKDFDSSLVSFLEKSGIEVKLSGGQLLNEFGLTNGVNESLEVLSRLVKVSNGLLPEKLNSINIGRVGKKGILGMYHPREKALDVYYSSLERKEEVKSNFNVTAFFNYNGSRFGNLSTSAHEFGHFVDFVYKDKLGNTLSHKILADPKARKQAVSRYGNKNELEAFAEAFTLYCYGVGETKLGNPYYQEFKRVMQKEGLSAFNGCLVPSTNGKAVTPKKSNTSSSSIRSSKSTNGKAITPKKSSISSTPVRVNKSTNGKAVRNKPSPLPKPAVSGGCPNCGGAISSDWNFCQHCGYKLK